ncbi:MAG: ComEA family DNA-binding protein [Gottschalkiaceae bacterium]|nr:MAG: ComEA family DNA-binding protein [Gottschalkiaceae bacterium]
MLNFTKRERIVILVFVIILASFLIYPMYANRGMKLEERDKGYLDLDNLKNVTADSLKDEVDTEEDISQTIIVHIDGEVIRPGVVELNEGARVIDVINIAGGLTQYADEKMINLAKKVYDEEKIYIPKIGEEISQIEITSFSQSNNTSTTQTKININTATKEELQKLSGIGPVIAERIIEYRSTNKFSNIDDIKKVSGIGDKKFDSIKDYITVK